ncbi:hypothetical protein MOX02_53830 [Methylobacterium oxalidis]|uniref:Uncharacterized protein n=1 Tax=Methylobacterium oxalidis TaxID=944322 RepID=A0A512JBS2_9HYPH|nr:hypothetical protein MOX02_53830 [Methylobacterium oxalidis]GLS61699.1 hypothetical protein GCM10007888_00800 [Methylobacterium oxalidis]
MEAYLAQAGPKAPPPRADVQGKSARIRCRAGHESARPLPAGRSQRSRGLIPPQAVSTVEGSTFTPGPIVEVTAMRWM